MVLLTNTKTDYGRNNEPTRGLRGDEDCLNTGAKGTQLRRLGSRQDEKETQEKCIRKGKDFKIKTRSTRHDLLTQTRLTGAPP